MSTAKWRLNMIKKTIFCVCLIMLLARCGYGENNLGDLDGNEWQEMGESEVDGATLEKTTFIEGFMCAINYVVERNMDELEQSLMKHATEEGEKVSEFLQGAVFQEKSRNINLQRYSIYNITVGQTVDGIDILYKDFKNKGIKISDAIYVVKRQIEGTSPEDIEKILIYLRSNYENYEPLITRDKTGKIINYIQFP